MAQVVASSLTQNETIDVRGVFFMMLAMADKGGNVCGVNGAIARIMNVPLEVFERAAARLQLPDPASQSGDFEGRRIVPLDGTPGFFIVNYAKYSQIASDAQRREYLRVKKAQSRARLNGEEVPATGEMPPTLRMRSSNRPKSVEEVIEAGKMAGVLESGCRKFWNHYEGRAKEDENGRVIWMTGSEDHPVVVGNWRNLLATWKAKDEERAAKEAKNPRRWRDRSEAEKEPERVIIRNIKSYGQSGEQTPVV